MTKDEVRGHLSIFGAEVLWGLMAPATKLLYAGAIITPLMLMDMRFFGAAILFWAATPFMKKEHVPHQDLLKLFFAALFSIIFNQGMYSFGLSLTSPIDASICTTSMPLIAMILAAIYLKEPVTQLKVMGIAIGAAGAVLLIESGQQVHGGNTSGIWGDLCVLIAQTSFACYLVFFKDLIKKYSAFTLMKWMFTYASICMIPFSYNTVYGFVMHAGQLRSLDWMNIAIVVIGGTFFSYLLLPLGQKNLRPTVTAIYNYVQPVVASAVAIFWGLDSFNLMKGIAVVLVFTGVAFVTQSKSRKQMEAYKKAQAASGKETSGNQQS